MPRRLRRWHQVQKLMADPSELIIQSQREHTPQLLEYILESPLQDRDIDRTEGEVLITVQDVIRGLVPGRDHVLTIVIDEHRC